jgi:PAS domain-containing protein
MARAAEKALAGASLPRGPGGVVEMIASTTAPTIAANRLNQFRMHPLPRQPRDAKPPCRAGQQTSPLRSQGLVERPPNADQAVMHARATPTPDHQDMVTASDLVRRFGHWGERALATPVYVLHRGRPRLVLASVELIDALCRPYGAADADDARRVAALLDGSPGMIVVVDRAQSIAAASRSVRARFGDLAMPGAPAGELVEPDNADALAQAIARVTGSALAETIDVALAGNPGRRIALAIEPHPDGVVLFGRAGGTDPAEDRASLDETFALSRGAAVARIDRYGFLDGPHTALAALTGIGVSMLSSLRFVSLFSIQSRAGVADLIAAVGEDGEPRSGTARLLTDAGDPRQVTVAFAPRRRGAGIDGVVALILAVN